MSFARRSATLLTTVSLIGIAIGCQKASPTTPLATAPGASPTQSDALASPGEFDAESGPHAAGKKVLVANGCFRCHAVNGVRGQIGGGSGGPGGSPRGGPGPGGPPGGGGKGFKMGGGSRGAPDLGHTGKDPTHTADWLAKFIRNPKSVKADAKMPSFEGKIKENDLRALTAYLASLK